MSSGRVDFLGIDNATLDFSQLEDYINDEEDPNESIFSHGHGYFNDNLVTGDLKLPDSPRSVNHHKLPTGHLNLGNNNSSGEGEGGRLPGEAVQQSLVSSSQSSGVKGNVNRLSSVTTLTVPGNGGGVNPVNPPGPIRPSSVQINQGSNIPIDHPGGGNNNGTVTGDPEIDHLSQIRANHQHLQHHHHHHQLQQQHHHPHPHHHHHQQHPQQQPSHHQHPNHPHHPHHQQQQQQLQQNHHHQPQSQHHQNFSSFNKHPHHLPESPPDSGSEPPYSPPNDENRMNNSNQGNIGSLTTNNSNKSKMIQSNLPDKHFNHYNTNNQINLLPNTDINGLTLPPNHIHSPRNGNLGQLNTLHCLNGSIQGHHDENILSHLGPTVITGPISLQSSNIISGLSPLSTGQPHLTTLYPGGTNGTSDCVEIGKITRNGQSNQSVNGQSIDHQQSTTTTASPTTNGGQNKKRRHSESHKNGPNNMVHVKQEPGGGMSPEPGNLNGGGSISGTVMVSMEDEYGFDYNTNTEGPPSVYLDSAYQCIRFQIFQQSAWHTLCDTSLKELPVPNYRVDADKGFNFSNADDAFVCQKKNHFQVTVHVQPIGDPQFVKTPDSVRKVDNFYLHFYGVKVESPSQTIKVEQSQSDRSKKPFHPVLIELCPDQVSKTTVGRLHFSETTSNNMRKKGKPNPDQRYFYLVVSLCAHVGDQSYPIVSHASERIIVRASNPGQFENDMELSWQKGHSPESIYHAGRVGINTDRPDEPLVVHGNVKVTGHIIQPSDMRAKTNIEEISTREQLQNVANIRVVRYQFTPEFAQQVGLKEEDINGTGIIAQEVQKILPDAIKETDDVILPSGERIEKLLVVNKERIFMENVGAVKELCKVTDNLETRIDELERMNRKLRRINRFDSIKSILSSTSSVTSASTVTCISNYSGTPGNKRLACKLTHPYESNQSQQLPNNQQQQSRKCSKHANNNNGYNQEDNQVCTNRFMQSIIMILVLIMAFCLASIVTLYILDYPRHHANHLNQPHNKVDHQFQHNSFTLNKDNNSQSYSSSSSHHNPSYLHPSSSSSPPTINSYHDNRKQSIDSKSSLLPSQSGIDQKKGQSNITQRRTVNTTWKSAFIPILKPRILGQIVGCASSGQEISSISCNIHCCLENDGAAESVVPLIGDDDNDSHDTEYESALSSSSSSNVNKTSYRTPKEIETITKSKEVLRLSKEEDNPVESMKKPSPSFSLTTPSPISSSSSLTPRSLSTQETSSPPVPTLIISSTPLSPKISVTSSIKLTGDNNLVSEEISSRANHGRYLTSEFGPSSSSVNNVIAPGIETGSHINNLAVDNINSFNYSTIEVSSSSNKTLDPIEQHLTAKVDSFSNDKFVSYNSHQPPSSIFESSKTSTDYREKRETRETRESRLDRQNPRNKYQTDSSGLPVDWNYSMKLLELNATIGREFCYNLQCIRQESLQSYSIPISKYMAHEYVTLQFSLTSALKVDNCAYNKQPIACPSLPPGSVPHAYHRPSEHLPIAESNPSFRIPIGLYLESSYVFRILSKERDAKTPCSLPQDELGSSFIEIRLSFRRYCEH